MKPIHTRILFPENAVGRGHLAHPGAQQGGLEDRLPPLITLEDLPLLIEAVLEADHQLRAAHASAAPHRDGGGRSAAQAAAEDMTHTREAITVVCSCAAHHEG